MKALVVANAAARGAVGELAGEAAALLGAEPALAVETIWPESRDETRARVMCAMAGPASRESPPGVVVAVGGDGTARDVAFGLADGIGRWDMGIAPASGREGRLGWCGGGTALLEGAPPVLVVVPAGTGNSLYREVWDDVSWQEVVGMGARYVREPLRTGNVSYLDMGRVEGGSLTGTPFLLGASVGFLAETVRASLSLDHLTGRQRYAAAAVEALKELRPFSALVSVDGEVLAEGEMAMIAIGGARRRGGTLAVLPDSVLDDGLLDVCVVGATTAEILAGLLARASSGARWGDEHATFGRGRVVAVEALDGRPITSEVDGDLCEVEETRLAFRVVPHAVPVLEYRRIEPAVVAARQ